MTATGAAARALAASEGQEWAALSDEAKTAYRQTARVVLRAARAWMLLCAECGQDHPWRRDAKGRPVRATDHPYRPGTLKDPDTEPED